jgi:phosphoenolpyruvate carboxylase
MRQTKPTVMEEIMTGLDYFRYSLFDAVCTTYRYAENSLKVRVFWKVTRRFVQITSVFQWEFGLPCHPDVFSSLLCFRNVGG